MARNKKPDDCYNAPFPSALRELLREHGETQGDIAAVTGKTRQTVSQYYNGISEPSYDTLVKIADHFDVSLDYLLGRTKEPHMTPSAVDELGLSPETIRQIKQSREWEEETNILNHKEKDANFDNCFSAHGALNTFLEKSVNSTIFAKIFQLSVRIYNTKETELPDYLQPWSGLVDRLGKVSAQDISAGAKLTHELYELHPDLAGFFRVVYGAEDFSLEIDGICSEFRHIVEEMTGYSDYVNSNK